MFVGDVFCVVDDVVRETFAAVHYLSYLDEGRREVLYVEFRG